MTNKQDEKLKIYFMSPNIVEIMGSLNFRTLRFQTGCPDGGEGGNGGRVIFVADGSVRSLGSLNTNYHGGSGGHGSSSFHAGRGGADILVKVPLGTVIKSHEDGTVLADLLEEGNSFTAAEGGEGGSGNALFDPFKSTKFDKDVTVGSAGEERVIEAEMRTIADVGMVGFPNAGKSSLLRALSRATPKVAAYPFTTLKPQIGVIEDEWGQQLADIPGLISGAHENKGLGHAFLRHIERCKALLFVVDVSSTDPSPSAQLDSLQFELKMYNPELSNRVGLVVANKMDLMTVDEGDKEVIGLERASGLPVAPISALRMTLQAGHWWNGGELNRSLFKMAGFSLATHIR